MTGILLEIMESTSHEELGFISENYFIMIRGTETGFDFQILIFRMNLYTYSSNFL